MPNPTDTPQEARNAPQDAALAQRAAFLRGKLHGAAIDAVLLRQVETAWARVHGHRAPASADAIIRRERAGHGGTRWQCSACHLIGTVQGPGDTCRSCGYVHDRHGRGQHRAVSVS